MIFAKNIAITPAACFAEGPATACETAWLHRDQPFRASFLMVSSRQSNRQQPVNIRVVDANSTGRARPSNTWIAEQAQRVLEGALVPSQRDDRFHGWEPPPDLVAAIAEVDDEPIAYLGGAVDRGRLQLDGLITASKAAGADGQMFLAALYHALEPSITATGADTIELWGKPAESWHRSLANREGFAELRSLHQLRCGLPIDAPTLTTRDFVPGQDEERLLRVNNRAFAAHPDQGNLTVDDLAEAAAQPWFDPRGIRLYQDPDDPDRLAGFCWTKIHEPLDEGEPRLGEIYAIGVDPDHHGKGLGKPMTAAGLAWLSEQGLTTGMLYVEADNEPALRTYYKLGFERHRTDTAWHKRT